ncbi:hypothetical protein [Ensifer aridi]|uniref:hypothetical protein n=1 Tax=Ensifer aridi TaxID=1708715 RepID=UPI000A0F9C70|nr:hypothetical protein [Ensifer aridi]
MDLHQVIPVEVAFDGVSLEIAKRFAGRDLFAKAKLLLVADAESIDENRRAGEAIGILSHGHRRRSLTSRWRFEWA